MPLWFFQFLLFAAVLFALLYALSQRGKPQRIAAHDITTNDMQFYKSLLNEIALGHYEDEKERAAARLEISRKLLKNNAQMPLTNSLKVKRVVVILLLLLLPLGSFGVYAALGNPTLPAQPLASRSLPANSPLLSLIAKVETHLAKNPDDAKGWEVLAPIYLKLENYERAVEARRNLLRLQGTSPERLGDFGEALLMRNNGVLSQPIEAVFKEALALEPSNMRANYYLGLALLQDGKAEAARELWENLLKITTKEEEKAFLTQELLQFQQKKNNQ
jgi:cytochrome c-type biogenesis protein CcmH